MAVTVVTGSQSYGINYTHRTDSSADWNDVPVSTYFYDLTTKLAYHKNSLGSIISIFDNNGGGKVAIADSDGIFVYYATLTAAFAAATSGSTIQLMTSMTEILTTTLTIPLGVNFNLNGNTLTIDQNNSNTSFSPVNFYVGKVTNGTIIRTNGTGAIFYSATSAPEINFTGLVTEYNGGYHVSFNSGTFIGIRAKGTSNVVLNGASHIGAVVTVTSGVCFQLVSATRCSATATTGICYNQGSTNYCVGSTTTGNVYNNIFLPNGRVMNSTGYSSNGYVFNTSNVYNCFGSTLSSDVAFVSICEYVKLTTVSGRALVGDGTHCLLRSDSSYCASMGNSVSLTFCTMISNWNDPTARAVVMGTNCDVSHNDIKMANASSYAIGNIGSSSYGGLNTVRGCAAVYDPAHTQLTVNTSDSQGNLLKI
jgi:hypothetical protein